MIVKEIIDRSIYGNQDSDQHLITLFSIALTLKAKNILELGVRDGTTTVPFLEACEYLDGHLTSVDINNTQFKPLPQHEKRWTFIQSDAIEFLKQNQQPYDLIFIDDWHATDHVYTELSLLKPFLTPNVVVLLHDLMHTFSHPKYNNSEHRDGEWKGTGPYGAVVKFVKENPEFEFATLPVCHGLTILRKAYDSNS